MECPIEVYADWSDNKPAKRLGTLRVRPGRTGELFDFTFDDAVIRDTTLAKQALDPDLGLFPGPQFPRDGRTIFGVFRDSSPDRWGEALIRRRFDRDRRAGLVPRSARLGESDYLLGVCDTNSTRMGRSLTIVTEALRRHSFDCASWRPRAAQSKTPQITMIRQ
jgi:serine/threonine-protein kinase HipA